ncbi:hypothetical protein Tco_0585978 [Tanacetum coccineum]
MLLGNNKKLHNLVQVGSNTGSTTLFVTIAKGRVNIAKRALSQEEKDKHGFNDNDVVGIKLKHWTKAITEEEIAFADTRTSKIALMANLSRKGSDALTEDTNR